MGVAWNSRNLNPDLPLVVELDNASREYNQVMRTKERKNRGKLQR